MLHMHHLLHLSLLIEVNCTQNIMQIVVILVLT